MRIAALALLLAVTACSSPRMGGDGNPTDAKEVVSFNDGATSCIEIEVKRTANRYDIADALSFGAEAVEQNGCVNYAFID
jgi:hypothetical protein